MEKKIILASQSPRRSEILKNANYYFVSFPTHVSEIPDKNLNVDQQIIDIARRKARFCLLEARDNGLGSMPSKPNIPNLSNDIILAADTMVCLQDQILGKPNDENMAFDFLKSLSGRTHQVKTAVYLIDVSSLEELSLIETTDVTFRTLTDQEIKDYIKTGEPMDKAGAYAIQGLGRSFVSSFTGDFNNVVGLPLHAIEKVFKIKSWTFTRLP
ncbi:MAG: Maf family protein [Pseudobdellovibrio sp.]